MAEYKPQVGNVGLLIKVDMQEDISQATNLKFIVRKPDGLKYNWTPITIEGTIKLVYIVQTADFNQAGVYWLWPYLKLGAWEGECEPASFLVYD